MPLTTKEKRLIELKKAGGTDRDLILLDEIDELKEKMDKVFGSLTQSFQDSVKELSESVNRIKILKGDKGDSGEDYILTENDKKEIAGKIAVPIVEKVVEKTETIRELPIVTNEIKEVAVAENPEKIRDKLETLTKEERLDISAIRGLEKYDKDILILKESRPIFGPGKTKIYIKDLSASLDGNTKSFFIG